MLESSDNVPGLGRSPLPPTSASYAISLPDSRPFIDPPSHGSMSHIDDMLVVDNEIQDLKRRIISLEEFEMNVAQEYGMQSEEIDSPAILQKAKEIVWSLNGPSQEMKDRAVQTAGDLDALYKLRCSLSELQRARAVLHLQAGRLEAPANNEFRSTIDASRFWVVIIGIDAYRQFPLQGCVFDAVTMKKYFNDLGVPQDRVCLLLGRLNGSMHDSLFPSRGNIIKTLHDIRNNPLIEKGDSIIIYFSGHGSHYFCSNYFYNTAGGSAHLGSVEAICPADRDELDREGNPISDISDRELNTILSLIRDIKGDNITLILDCCHSGSATRGMSLLAGLGCSRDLPPVSNGRESMLQCADTSLRKYWPGAPSVLAENWSPDMTSHVVLAACREFEFAREVRRDDGNVAGIFTSALVTSLRSGLGDRVTYAELCSTLRDFMAQCQTPAVAGRKKDSFVWYQV
ncbi:hypothetical protein IW261DRAFT_1559707 [Armillaria novae-zelandiae]|uniref:Peptidase C14 caspase domain-containing protein n=1 Tax=Armillaria novae-zelandiae TaxID=153914 RepID=A0AA39PL37_9AGAR|nr:hypothetical protein IW261DRAFT_1559707 [Armillaria novae-zelandiae]